MEPKLMLALQLEKQPSGPPADAAPDSEHSPSIFISVHLQYVKHKQVSVVKPPQTSVNTNNKSVFLSVFAGSEDGDDDVQSEALIKSSSLQRRGAAAGGDVNVLCPLTRPQSLL